LKITRQRKKFSYTSWFFKAFRACNGMMSVFPYKTSLTLLKKTRRTWNHNAHKISSHSFINQYKVFYTNNTKLIQLHLWYAQDFQHINGRMRSFQETPPME
jgi:hypothetical protein